MPIPDSSRPAAIQLALKLNIPYREGFIKNRYIGRTFLMPGQGVREKSVRQKLNAIGSEFKGKTVLLVDDSIVRGTTSREIVQMAREAGAKRVIFASAAPPVIFPNVYGIDMPTRDELIAYGRSVDEVCREITADALVYQDIDALKRSISDVNPALTNFEASCFDGIYVTGDVSQAYLDRLEYARHHPKAAREEDAARSQLNLNLATSE
jgi:amidophosphoribosyltransferase